MSACIAINFYIPRKHFKQRAVTAPDTLSCAPHLSGFANHKSTTLTAYALAKVQQTIHVKMEKTLHNTIRP